MTDFLAMRKTLMFAKLTYPDIVILLPFIAMLFIHPKKIGGVIQPT
jgi:hypothetical protein